ncbi:hypothetical protein, partial [Streptomyces sp. NPDC004788]
MNPVVPGLGVAALTASGCVWYVPALADLRAGADRPVSRRLAAAACLAGWATAAVTALLLLVGAPARPLSALGAAGAGACLALRLRAAVRRRSEEREDAVCWTALKLPPPVRGGAPRPLVFARTIGAGLTLALAAALAPAWVRPHGIPFALAATAPVALAACTLLTAVAVSAPR